jgi:hypothetical protein
MTTERKPRVAALLSLTGAFLMFINALLVGINNAPIIISSGPVRSPSDVIGIKAPLWFRISFGIRGWVEGSSSIIWIIAAIITMYLAVRLYARPLGRKGLCTVILALSILSVVYGGGFVIGLILGILGAGMGYEWPTQHKNTIAYKIIMAMKFDSNLYEGLKTERNALRNAVYALVLVNILTGAGIGLYSIAVQRILGATATSDLPFRIIFLGELPFDLSIFSTIIINVGLAILKWFALSFIIYLVAIALLERKQTFARIAAATAFAYAPVSLQLIMPFIFTSQPNLATTWPLYLLVVTNIWMALALVKGIGQTLEANLGKALGILSLSGAIYLLLYGLFFSTFDIPNIIRLTIQPQSALLVLVSSLAIGSLLFEIYNKS